MGFSLKCPLSQYSQPCHKASCGWEKFCEQNWPQDMEVVWKSVMEKQSEPGNIQSPKLQFWSNPNLLTGMCMCTHCCFYGSMETPPRSFPIAVTTSRMYYNNIFGNVVIHSGYCRNHTFGGQWPYHNYDSPLNTVNLSTRITSGVCVGIRCYYVVFFKVLQRVIATYNTADIAVTLQNCGSTAWQCESVNVNT